MFKAIALLKCKEGLSRAEFIHYYETRHVPLILSHQPQIRDYRRNFINLEGAFIYPGTTAPDFDVVTELWFDSRAAYDEALAVITRKDVAEIIARDEENFLDRSKTRFFTVDEHIAKIG